MSEGYVLSIDRGTTGTTVLVFADMLGVPLEVARVTEATAPGAAYLAGLAVGHWESRAELNSHNKAGRRYEPVMSGEDKDRLRGNWARAVGRAGGWARPRS